MPSGHSDTVLKMGKVLPSINGGSLSARPVLSKFPLTLFRVGPVPSSSSSIGRARTVHQLQWLGFIRNPTAACLKIAWFAMVCLSESPHGLRHKTIHATADRHLLCCWWHSARRADNEIHLQPVLELASKLWTPAIQTTREKPFVQHLGLFCLSGKHAEGQCAQLTGRPKASTV